MLERELAPPDGDDRFPWMGMPPSEPTCIKGELGDHDIPTALDLELAKVLSGQLLRNDPRSGRCDGDAACKRGEYRGERDESLHVILPLVRA